jgi:hypothetical protein
VRREERVRKEITKKELTQRDTEKHRGTQRKTNKM